MRSAPPAVVLALPTDMGSFLTTLGHTLRRQIIHFLTLGEQSAYPLQAHLGLTLPATSLQTRFMAHNAIPASRRAGNGVLYRVANALICKILECMH